ncbi:hypothetical protein M9Y10_007859 [Tritrichomonas musculus]|uniref:Protein kinase domain-containing protein n=1 Tax=Tritrichomonas musculus TaxID=1915356 RepID=A0ABR2J3A9_9EUKA
MIQAFFDFQNHVKEQNIRIKNEILNDIIRNYSFIHFFEKIDLNSIQNKNIITNIKESRAIVINQDRNFQYFFICFKNTLIIIEQSLLSLLDDVFMQNPNLFVFYLFEKKDIFRNQLIDKYKNLSYHYNEIEKFYSHLAPLNKLDFSLTSVWNIIRSSISTFLVEESYLTPAKNRIQNFTQKQTKNQATTAKQNNLFDNPNEYLILNDLGIGYASKVILFYHLKKEKFYAMKQLLPTEEGTKKLLTREFSNYCKISHPFLPKFYYVNEEKNFLIIEFIKGQTLDKQLNNLKEEERITIIFEILIVIEYLHHNKFIFRDLKPNNVMIDEYKNAVLIDFDRMLDSRNIKSDQEMTFDFQSPFVAEEIKQQIFSNEKADIYSIGMMIYYIINGKIPDKSKSVLPKDLDEMFKKCTNKKFEERPSSFELIIDFYINHHSQIQFKNFFDVSEYYLKTVYDSYTLNAMKKLSVDPNDPDVLTTIGFLYADGRYVSVDYDKALSYLENAANQDHQISQFILNTILTDKNYVIKDANKAIDYLFDLESKTHSILAQFILGNLFYNGEYVSMNMNKVIEFFTNTAKFIPNAAYNLGTIYSDGKYIAKDNEKAIYYYQLAAKRNFPLAQLELNQMLNTNFENSCLASNDNKLIESLTKRSELNDSNAQFMLGKIYIEGKHVPIEIDKGINYLNKSAEQNNSHALYYLGMIYEKGQFVQRDINKAINLYTNSANLNHAEAQFMLGEIYGTGKYGPKNINLSLHYYTLSANNNYVFAQYNLGVIYDLGINVSRNINYAIYYYTLASNQNFMLSSYKLFEIYFMNKDFDRAFEYLKRAADQNHPPAQYNLAVAYYQGFPLQRDIWKAIHYFKLAADQGFLRAQYNLGMIYFKGEHIKQDIEEAIHYLAPTAEKNDQSAQYTLGIIYLNPKYKKYNIERSIHYLTLSANQFFPPALFVLSEIYTKPQYKVMETTKGIYYLKLASNQQFPLALYKLGILYLEGKCIELNLSRGVFLLKLAANKRLINAHFSLGFLYQEGKFVKKDIEESIKYYKEASSFNNQYAKNNLGIVYKELNQINRSLSYFNEVIEQSNDPLAIYNLANIYFYERCVNDYLNKSIELLVSPELKKSTAPLFLLALAVISKVGYNIDDIRNEIDKQTSYNGLSSVICKLIIEISLNNEAKFKCLYEAFRNINYIYNHLAKPVVSSYSTKQKNTFSKSNDINDLFYEGFGNGLPF